MMFNQCSQNSAEIDELVDETDEAYRLLDEIIIMKNSVVRSREQLSTIKSLCESKISRICWREFI
jgi:hypothetical protein